MKKLRFLVGILALSQIAYGQCDQKMTFKCNKVRSFKNGSTGPELPIDAMVNIDSGRIMLTIKMNGETETVEGDIKEVSVCEWSEFLKNGKTQYKALTKKGNNHTENSIIEIQSANSHTIITFGSDPDTGSRLQLDVVEYAVSAEANPKKSPAKTMKKAKQTKEKTKKSLQQAAL